MSEIDSDARGVIPILNGSLIMWSMVYCQISGVGVRRGLNSGGGERMDGN